MSNLSLVWSQVEFLLDSGLSIIPVRDKDEISEDGKLYAKKTAYYKWKKYQTEIITKDELWRQMEQRNTSAIAIICGSISGNLEVIDIDTKYKSDAAINLFNAIKEFDIELYSLLRIHKTPSGGYHILYRINTDLIELPGNCKLAGRLPTEQELKDNPKAKPVNFLETRANGGYILAPPSFDYSIYKECPVPVISWQQREDLINISKTFDRIIKSVKPVYIPTEKHQSYYDKNPWDDFNLRCDPIELLTRYGWSFDNTKNSRNIYFTRPGKNNGISMSFALDIRKFYCFTVSTEFEPDTAYSPIDIILKLGFNDDKKLLYNYLVDNGFGCVKSKVETDLAVSLARKNKPLPGNFSQNAIKINKETIDRLKENHPFGIFIKYDFDEEKQAVSREALLYVANNLGFRYFNEETIRIVDNIIYKISIREFQDALKGYMYEEDANEYETLCNIFESFMQKNGAYTMSRLEQLDKLLILKDSKDICYKYYKNGFLTITKDLIEFNNYEDNNLLIWDWRVQKRDYIIGKGGDYVDFIKKSTTNEENVKKIIGYLTHEYKDETTGFIIVLTETCPDPKQGGGSGKNVFCNLLKLTTSYTSKPGAQAKFDENFFQSWNRQRLFAISDAPKHFDFEFLKEPSTGEFIWKKLFKDELSIPCDEAPKFIVQTNYSYEITDGGLKRRIKNIEFTDFFTKEGGLDVYYKKHFPDEWTIEDYAGFDNYIADCIQQWLLSGRKLPDTSMTDTGKQKQWEQTFGATTTGFILENIEGWISAGNVINEAFKAQFNSYISENNVSKNYIPSMIRVNSALEMYCRNNNIMFDKDVSIKDSKNNNFKYRIFKTFPF